MQNRMYTIGAPIIVKDEIRCIDRCLDTLVGRLDQIVVMDTGSTDGTLERLRMWEACYPEITVVEEPWDGNFSSMRNKVQAYITTDFCFIIDADEWMPIPNKGTSKDPWLLIERCLQEQGDRLDCAYIYLMNHLPGGQVITGDIVPALRVFSNRPEIKWAGRVHNQIQASVAANPRNGETIKLSYVHVTMEHDGYDLYRPEAKEKYTARLDLMKEEIKMHQEEGNNSLEAYYTFQLANGYHMCEMDQEAIETYRQLDYEALENHNKYNAAVIAIAVSIKLDEDKDMDIWMDRLMELAPTQPIVLLHKATVLNKKEEFLEAYPYGAAAIALNRDPNIKRTHMLDEEYCSGLLAELCFKTEMYNEAVMYARRYLDKYPGNPAMRNIDGVSTGVIRDTLLHLYGPDQNLSEVEEDS